MGLPIQVDEYLYGIGGSLSLAAMRMEVQDASIKTRKIQPVKSGSKCLIEKRKELKQHTELKAAIFFIPSS